jgi:hypothetical protein
MRKIDLLVIEVVIITLRIKGSLRLLYFYATIIVGFNASKPAGIMRNCNYRPCHVKHLCVLLHNICVAIIKLYFHL